MDLIEHVNAIWNKGGVILIRDKRLNRRGKVVEMGDTGMSVQWANANGCQPLRFENLEVERYEMWGKLQ